jgi:hypothetical protein
MPTKAEKEYYGKVARLGCSLCKRLGYQTEDVGCELHHIRRGSLPRNKAPVIPLCPYHHRSSNSSFHSLGRKKWEQEFKVTQEELLEDVIAQVGQNPTL